MKIAAKGETGTARCASCFSLFTYIGDGIFIPVDCPSCSAKRTQHRQLSPEEQAIIDEIEKMLA